MNTPLAYGCEYYKTIHSHNPLAPAGLSFSYCSRLFQETSHFFAFLKLYKLQLAVNNVHTDV
jgi:hypothetical protein